jgi:hypothetical protein
MNHDIQGSSTKQVSLGTCTETKHNCMEIFIATDTASVQIFSTYSPPELRHLSYRGTNFGILCRRSLPPGIGTTVFWCQLLRHSPGAQFP